jgi:uncharacterized RDD family membrane protein YckC
MADFFLVWLPLLIAGFLLAAALGNFGVALLIVDFFYVFFGYDVMCERLFNGRTLGKRMVGLRVLRAGGARVDVISSAMRAVLTVFDFWTFTPLVAIVSALVTKKNQRLGDLAASTIVVREPKRGKGTKMKIIDVSRAPAPSPTPQLPADWRPPAAQGATVTATLVRLDTSAVTRADVTAINAFLDRRATLDPQIRADLAARMAGALRTRVGGGIDELSDEELIATVADTKSRENKP